MTYTAHGHHIPGSAYTDELDEPLAVARCGGPQVCRQCYSEWRHESRKSKPKAQVQQLKKEATATGSGTLTAGELLALLQEVPEEAIIALHSTSSPQEGALWRFIASWGESTAVTARRSVLKNTMSE